MIVSASYRTDIPAFYGDWLMRRLDAGFCRVVNPYGGAPLLLRLTPDAVEGFVFWTRNPARFLPHLVELKRRGYPFVVQVTITGYPRPLETSVPAPTRAVADLCRLADLFGPGVAVWRYDPVLLTSITDADWHLENFTMMAASVTGATDEVVVSFAQFYAKTGRNLAAAGRSAAFAWSDPDDDVKRALLGRLAAVAADHGLRFAVCSQPNLLVPGAVAASCIDAARLGAVAKRPIAARRRGNRPGCACDESRDIGAYDSCPQGCVYCYAVTTPSRAKERHRAHDPEGEFLIPPARAP